MVFQANSRMDLKGPCFLELIVLCNCLPGVCVRPTAYLEPTGNSKGDGMSRLGSGYLRQ